MALDVSACYAAKLQISRLRPGPHPKWGKKGEGVRGEWATRNVSVGAPGCLSVGPRRILLRVFLGEFTAEGFAQLARQEAYDKINGVEQQAGRKWSVWYALIVPCSSYCPARIATWL